ncbi:MAG: ornithine carbamoyltransferase [Firmicutes bacterium]|nr:ornithine carbamoyltransferase [Bacillota bacterium]MCL5039063.1 ornithine carbamoyltransferase [Bacillota bacterium]
MQSMLRGKHMITTQEWTKEELETVFDLADELKRQFGLNIPHRLLPDKTLFMIFFDNSTRTRNSFEAGMTQLGGHAHDLSPDKLQISHGENARDTANVLSRYGHAIGVRHTVFGEGNGYIRDIARNSRVPVFNLQCDIYHPFQILADYLTIREKFGKNTRGLKIGVSWTSAPNYVRPVSVPQSLILLMPRFGLDVTLAHPPEFRLMPEIVEQAKKNAAEAGVKFETVDDMSEAFRDADIVIPKSWGPLVHTRDKKEGLELINKYPGWICDEKMMELTRKHSIYMHPLPADRGREVTGAVIDGPHSVVYDEAENRLHVQKAVMALTMGGRP